MKSIRMAAAIAAVGCLGAFAPAALAAPSYSMGFSMDDHGSSVWAYPYTQGGTTYKLDIYRGGTLLSSGTEGWGSTADLPGAKLASGDTAQLSVDGVVKATVAYDGTPTIGDDACVGRASFSGARNPDAAGQWAGVYHPGGGYGHSNPVLATSLSGSSYTISLTAPLTAGDVVYAGTEQIIGDVDVNSTVERSVTACPTPPAPQALAPAPAPATKAQVLAGLKQSLAKATKDLKSVDARKLAKQGALPVGFTFLAPGTVKFTLTAPAAKAKKASAAKKKNKKAAKALVIAAGTKVSTTPGRTAVSLKLTAAGRKLLRRGKPVTATVSAAFTPAGGGTAQKAQASVKIKRVKTKAHRRH